MSATARDYLDKLVAITDITAMPLEKALQDAAHLVDLSSEFDDPQGTARALEWFDALAAKDLTPGQRSRLEFYRANAWDNRRCERYSPQAYASEWEQPELRSQLLSLRRAVNATGLQELEKIERAQILTNLGNQLSGAGRVVDACEYWGRAVTQQPNFAMALGNRGCGWFAYARAYYDDGHQAVFLYRAYQSLSAALANDAEWGSAPEGARETFAQYASRIERMIDVKHFDENLTLNGYGLGRSKRERAYRQWALKEALFLNPLNDLGPDDIASTDALTLPSYRTSLDDGPTLIAFFNQMKQEFVSARWLLFEGMTADALHFSDRLTKLFDTLDDPGYSLAVEKMKLAFRSAYSLLDKVAFFLNDYLKRGIALKDVSFRSLWFERGHTKLRPAFNNADNWPLRGLYWLAKDFVEPEFQASTEPDAEDIAKIRNHLEHRYLKIHEPNLAYGLPRRTIYEDRLALSVEREDFEAKALRVLKLARVALIHLCLAMKHEEGIRDKNATGIAVPMILPSFKPAP